MPTFLFALVAAAIASTGARDQLLLAELSARLGPRRSLLAVAALVSLASCGLAAWAGDAIGASLPTDALRMLVAIALLLAAVELAWPIRRKPITEPTLSLFAIALVLAARQLGDGARFLVFALAAAAGGAPLLAGLGGALGSVAALALGWGLGEDLRRRAPLRAIRLTLAAVLLVLALVLGLAARGLLG